MLDNNSTRLRQHTDRKQKGNEEQHENNPNRDPKGGPRLQHHFILHPLLGAYPGSPIRSVEIALDARAEELELVVVGGPGVPALNSRVNIDKRAQVKADEKHA